MSADVTNRTLVDVAVSVLKPHPENQEYFDDISGNDYENLKSAIQIDGIRDPIIVSPDMTIISGHQRVRIAKDLNISQVPVIIYSDIVTEDDKVRNLISENFGRSKNSEAKQRKAVAKYVELVGSPHGGDRKSRDQNGLLNERLTLDQIAEQLDISKTELKRILSIERNLTDSMKELLDSGVIGKTLAADCIASMTPEEQEELVSTLDATKKYTTRELQPYIDKIKKLERAASDMKEKVERQFTDRVETLQGALSQAREDADTYKEQYEEAQAKLAEAQNTIKSYSADYSPSNTIPGMRNNTKELVRLSYRIQKMLDEDLSPLKFSQIVDAVKVSPTDKRILCEIIDKVAAWCRDMESVIDSEDIIEGSEENEATIVY